MRFLLILVQFSVVFFYSVVIHGEGCHFCCNVIAIREEETQEEYSSDRGVVEPWMWLLCEHTARSRIRVEEKTREHENHNFELKDTSQDQSASRRLKGVISFLMPDEEHLGGFSQMGFHVISCV